MGQSKDDCAINPNRVVTVRNNVGRCLRGIIRHLFLADPQQALLKNWIGGGLGERNFTRTGGRSDSAWAGDLHRGRQIQRGDGAELAMWWRKLEVECCLIGTGSCACVVVHLDHQDRLLVNF